MESVGDLYDCALAESIIGLCKQNSLPVGGLRLYGAGAEPAGVR